MRTAHLAGGWKQRLALGCALLHSPAVLFLDEPTSGVDPPSRRRFWDLIYKLSGEGVTIFVSTHYLDEAEHCDRLGLIYSGELIALGTPDELRQASSRKRFYKEEIVEIICDRAGEALDALGGVAGVHRVALYGQGVHVAVDNAAAAIPELRARLEERSFPLRRIAQIQPSMEDVFLSHIDAYRQRQESAA